MVDINTGTCSSRLVAGRKADNISLTKIIFVKSQKVKTGCKLIESSKKGYGSKMNVLTILMMII
jgi:ethanolamine ammonia-lyase small subunit